MSHSGYFRRHDNCVCSVSFENGRQRQDVWSKRSWEVPDVGEGAPSPSVLTDEQAKKLEQRNLGTFRGLTSSGDNDKIRNIRLDDVKDAVNNSKISENMAKQTICHNTQKTCSTNT